MRGPKEDEAQPLRLLEQENARLKKIIAEHALDISMLTHEPRSHTRKRYVASWK